MVVVLHRPREDVAQAEAAQVGEGRRAPGSVTWVEPYEGRAVPDVVVGGGDVEVAEHGERLVGRGSSAAMVARRASSQASL